MASSLRDTLCSLTFVYLVLVAGTVACGAHIRTSVLAACVLFETIWYSRSVRDVVRIEKHVNSLGLRAPMVKGWLLFHIDFVVALIWYVVQKSDSSVYVADLRYI